MKPLPLLLLGGLCSLQPMPAADYDPILPRLHTAVEQEMKEWEISGVALALIDGQSMVHAAGFGEARRDSIFRAGSISKLFNAVAVMQLVEAGRLDLDAPIPEAATPVNPFPDQPAVTLRQLLSHRSGLVRESPAGSYFHEQPTPIDTTVRSVATSVLVTRPTEKTRYSNCGPTIAGWMVAQAAGQSFEAYQQHHLLGPLGMTSSFWTLASAPRDRLIKSHMRLADGRGGWSRIESPVFDLGTIPAGNLFTTVEDLGRFASALLAGGGGLLKPDTLAAMWKPQFTEDATGFGLGFVVGTFRSHRTIGHSGAVYGHSASFVVLPDAGISVVIIGNEDIANGRIKRLNDVALSLMLEAKSGENPPPPPPANPLPPGATALAGDYESQSFWARIEIDGDRLRGDMSGQPVVLQPAGGLKFTGDSRIDAAVAVEFHPAPDGSIKGFSWGSQRFERVPTKPRPLPESWRPLLGSYGPAFIPIIISERHGHLYAMTENMVDYRLTPVTPHVFGLPPGMYIDEEVVIHPGPDGAIHGMDFAGLRFAKNP